MRLSQSGRKRALIVNCYADETRRPAARAHKIPQTIGPQFLAGGFHPDRWDIRLYNEMSHGPLEDAGLLGWPDILVLTGLITSLDRMRHVTAYARTRNPAVVVVGGGHVVRAFPQYCGTFMDYACVGDAEEIQDVIREAFGASFAADELFPRFDLEDWIGTVGYVEGSRYCNYKCTFCTLTAEGRKYKPYGKDYIRRQFLAAGKKRVITFLDNNFYGSDRKSFRERVEVAGEMRDIGQIDGWAALVTNDFFFKQSNMDLAKEAGCYALFTGVESFDPEWNARQNKRHNTVRPQVDIIHDCLESGIVFFYGLMLDLATRSIMNIRRELEFILDSPDITLPCYLSMPIPIPVTPFFYDCLDGDLILPSTKIRDLESTTISLRTLDPLAEAAGFMRDLQSLRGYRMRVLKHSVAFARKYRKRLNRDQMTIALANGALIMAPLMATIPRRIGRRSAPRTFISTTEPLDRFYEPAFRVDAKYEGYFQPTMLTDEHGRISDVIADDVAAGRPKVAAVGGVPMPMASTSTNRRPRGRTESAKATQ